MLETPLRLEIQLLYLSSLSFQLALFAAGPIYYLFALGWAFSVGVLEMLLCLEILQLPKTKSLKSIWLTTPSTRVVSKFSTILAHIVCS
jgi:hypothetical protein